MTRTTTRITALAFCAAIAAPVLTGSPATADVKSAAAIQQQDYVNALQTAHRDAEPYSVSADYARVLSFWAQHPDWGFGK